MLQCVTDPILVPSYKLKYFHVNYFNNNVFCWSDKKNVKYKCQNNTLYGFVGNKSEKFLGNCKSHFKIDENSDNSVEYELNLVTSLEIFVNLLGRFINNLIPLLNLNDDMMLRKISEYGFYVKIHWKKGDRHYNNRKYAGYKG